MANHFFVLARLRALNAMGSTAGFYRERHSRCADGEGHTVTGRSTRWTTARLWQSTLIHKCLDSKM